MSKTNNFFTSSHSMRKYVCAIFLLGFGPVALSAGAGFSVPPSGPARMLPELGVSLLNEILYKGGQPSFLDFQITYRSDLKGFSKRGQARIEGVSPGASVTVTGCFHLPSSAKRECFAPYISSSTPTIAMRSTSTGKQQAYDITNPQLVSPVFGSAGGKLLNMGGNWILEDFDENLVEQYNSAGQLIQVQRSSGQIGKMIYSIAGTPITQAPSPGYLIGIVDGFGRSIGFTYDSSGRPNSVIQPDGGVILFTYPTPDPSKNNSCNILGCFSPSSITFPDQSVKNYFWNEAAYSTNPPNGSALLTGVVDESANRLINFSYANGFVTGVSYGSAAIGAYAIQSSSLGNQAVLVGPNAVQTTVNYLTMQGILTFQASSQPAGSGSDATTQFYNNYDNAGNATAYVDFNGNETCTNFDQVRNLPTTIVEGFSQSRAYTSCRPVSLSSYIPSTADPTHPERKTSTIWHPDWSLKTREATPKKLTTWVYNGQPDPISGGTASCAPTAPPLPDGKPISVLCARYEQATTDATGGLGFAATPTGATRAWTYRYNQYGQVLTETTPRQSPTDLLSHTTTYVYYATTSFADAAGYTLGDLQSVTNPLREVTTYTSYDKAGRLLSSTDGNGMVTAQTYFPRGWLQSQTVTPAAGAALTTTYAYWPTGLLKTVTMPDASTLNFDYDGAQRLTDVIDGAGNKLHYVLDNAGNRTAEQLSNASGNLASSVARVYDALNRVQSATGVPR